jgi:hypothetical protein
VRALVEWLLARNELLPPMARGPKRLAVELTIIADVGLPWILVWQGIPGCGPSGIYPTKELLPDIRFDEM